MRPDNRIATARFAFGFVLSSQLSVLSSQLSAAPYRYPSACSENNRA